ncbi:hypothetical protein MKX01_007011 [Papaver californicum]|nr:hypothetical protein MKX01_007011 [Papaver californicum]
MSLSEGGRASSRTKILACDLKDEQPTNSKIQLGTSGSQTIKKEVSPLPASKSKKKNQFSSGQEGLNLNLKRSRSGRLLIPPLEFWRNQQVLYDKDGRIAVVEGSMPVLEASRGLSHFSSIGSKSEPPKAKRKLV